MSSLPILKGRHLVNLLVKKGFRVLRWGGSHCILKQPNGKLVSVPVHGGRDLAPGTLRSILRDLSISIDEFVKILKE